MRKYDILYDFDTALVSAAAAQQKNTVFAKYLKSGSKKEFENRTAFKFWLKDNPKWSLAQFDIIDSQLVIGSVRRAVEGLLGQMSEISESSPVRSVKFVVGGVHGNFRDKVAKIQPYKGQRVAKPLLFNSIKNKLIEKISSHIIQPTGSFESDDVLSMYLAEHKEHGSDSDRAISSPDKDLKMCVGWHADANRWDDEAIYTEDFEGFYQYCFQGLRGDPIDNIQGIPYAVESIQRQFGLRKGKGFGEVSAAKCLADCKSKEELANRVAHLYKETFKEGLKISTGEILSWTDVMDENMQLLKMLDHEGQEYKFSKEWGLT